MKEEVREVAATDATDFEAFFERHYPRLSKGLYLLTGSHAAAEELAQETMARVYERWARVRTMASPEGYATTVALNLWRRNRRHREPSTEPSTSVDPASVTESREDLRRTFRLLSPEQREAAVVVWWLGYSPAEAGRLLGIDPASVRGRLHRARTTIRKQPEGTDG